MRLLSSLFLFALSAQATTYTVCASGCSYTLSQLQTAVDNASAGDIIEIEAGATATVSGGLHLKNKSLTDWPGILIRSSKAYALPFNARVTPSADAANMATITSATSNYYTVGGCDKGAGYYRFHGIRFIPPASTSIYNIIEFYSRSPIHSNVNDTEISDLVHNIVFDQCIFDANGQNVQRGILANTGRLEVLNSWISGMHSWSYEEVLRATESNAIGGWNAKGPFLFRNNYFSAAAITTLFGGDTPTINGIKPDGAAYIGNHYYRSWKYRTRYKDTDPTGACLYDSEGGEWWKNTNGGSWYLHSAPPAQTYWECQSGTWVSVSETAFSKHYTQKNIFELKNAQRVWVEGNYLENSWQPADYNQVGAAILINQVDNDGSSTYEPASTIAHVKFRNNSIRRTARGVSIGKLGTTYWQRYRDITFENNLFDEIGDPRWTLKASERAGGYSTCPYNSWILSLNSGTRFRYIHNTINAPWTAPTGSTQGTVTMASESWLSAETAIVGNVVPFGWHGFRSEGPEGSYRYAVSKTNDDLRSISRNVVVNDQSQTVYSRPYPQVNLAYAAGYNDTGPFGCNSCGLPATWADVGMVDYAGGDYRLDAASDYKYFAHGKDPGADIDVVEWSTAGAVSGAPNPYLDFQVKSVTSTSSAVTLAYTSYNTEQCTLSVSAKWDLSSPSTQADTAGDRERTVSVGSLSAGTRYWWKLVCGTSAYHRTGVVVTR